MGKYADLTIITSKVDFGNDTWSHRTGIASEMPLVMPCDRVTERFLKGLSEPAIRVHSADHISIKQLSLLIGANRNAHGVENTIIITADIKKNKLLLQFACDYKGSIEARYFIITDTCSIIFGANKKEVISKASLFIASIWNDDYLDYGMTKEDLITSYIVK